MNCDLRVSFPHLLTKKKKNGPKSSCWYLLIGSAVGGLSQGPGALGLLPRAGEIPAQGFPSMPGAQEDTDIPSFAVPAWSGLPQAVGVSVLSPGSWTCAHRAVTAAGLGPPPRGQQRRDIAAGGQGVMPACPTDLRLLPDLVDGSQAGHRGASGSPRAACFAAGQPCADVPDPAGQHVPCILTAAVSF